MKNLKPITRHEQFLQDIADGEVDLKPITRQEYFLAKIAESGGGGNSLPSYTSSDVGKVLTVGEDEEHPEQLVIYQGGGTLVDAEFTLTGAEDALNALPVNDPITVSVTANGVTTVCDTAKTSDNEFLLTDLGLNSAIYKNGDVYTFWSQDLADGSSVTVDIYKVSPKYTPVWKTPEGMQTVTLSDAFNTGLQSLVQTAVTEMLTNQTKSAVKIVTNILTADDREKIRSACVAWADRQSMFFMFGAYFVPIMAGELSQGVYGVHTVMPYYSQVVGTNEYWFRVSVVNNSAGGTFLMVELTHSVGGAS